MTTSTTSAAPPDPLAAALQARDLAVLDRLREVIAEEIERRVSPPSPWLTVKSAAEYLGLSEDAIRSMINRKDVLPHKPNGRVFLSREILDNWVKGE